MLALSLSFNDSATVFERQEMPLRGLYGSGAGAIDDREADVNDPRAGLTSFRAIDDELRRVAADGGAVDPDRGQCGMQVGGELEIPETDHSQLPGHFDAPGLRLDQHTQCQEVGTAKHGVDL